MFIKSIKLKSFRNYTRTHCEFQNGDNLLIGENGQGKTNILEALYILGFVKSFRGVQDRDIMAGGGDSYFVMGVYEDDNVENTISIGFHQGIKQVSLNGKGIKRLSHLVGRLQMAAFTQNDIELITGSPSHRRRFMDMTLSLTFPKYLESFQIYHRALRQRNKALKDTSNHGSRTSQHKIWDEQLIDSGTELYKYRVAMFEPMNKHCQELYTTLNYDIKDFHLSYRPTIGDISSVENINHRFRQKLQDSQDRELLYKQTLYGPHRDDFSIRTGNTEFKRFASQGQTRAGALTLKLSLCGYVEGISGKKMILLLDDVLEDLDIKKKNKFLELVDGRQNFFSATSLTGYEPLMPEARIFKVESGDIREDTLG